jgi:hypothetical protein
MRQHTAFAAVNRGLAALIVAPECEIYTSWSASSARRDAAAGDMLPNALPGKNHARGRSAVGARRQIP